MKEKSDLEKAAEILGLSIEESFEVLALALFLSIIIHGCVGS